MQSHLIQGKGAAVTFKISILDGPYNSLTLDTISGIRLSMGSLWQIGTCFLIKGGKNSNKADAQGES